MGYLQPVEDLLDSDAIKYHRPAGTVELYGAVGSAEVMLSLMAHQVRQIVSGLGGLPTGADGLRTDSMAGALDPDEAVSVAMIELNRAAELVQTAAAHVRNAVQGAAHLYVDER